MQFPRRNPPPPFATLGLVPKLSDGLAVLSECIGLVVAGRGPDVGRPVIRVEDVAGLVEDT